MKPSIFNDVIGPVMRGPSSSHTAAAHRIGALIRQVCPPLNGKVLVEFDRKGSLATTYEGQGSAMGLICGLLGVSILDPNVVRYRDLVKEQGLNIDFKVTDFGATHPNTYKILVENNQKEQFRFMAISTGGGMIEINSLNDFNISIKGDYYETLICVGHSSSEAIQQLFLLLKENTPHSEIHLISLGEKDSLINIKSRNSLLAQVIDLTHDIGNILWIRELDPVMPILSGINRELPFSTADELIHLADQSGSDLADMAILYESARAGIDAREVVSLMLEIVLHIQNSIQEGMSGTY
jgi:L-serine dehydratase